MTRTCNAHGSHVRHAGITIGTRRGAATGVAESKALVAATFSGVNIYRFNQGGKVAEIWNHRDDLGFMEQVGVPS